MRRRIAEHMRMAANHLRIYISTHVVDVELSRIGGNLALQHNLQQHIPKLFPHMGNVVRLNCVNCLEGLLNHVVRNATVRLLAIPRATVGRAQSSNRCNERIEFFMF